MTARLGGCGRFVTFTARTLACTPSFSLLLSPTYLPLTHIMYIIGPLFFIPPPSPPPTFFLLPSPILSCPPSHYLVLSPACLAGAHTPCSDRSPARTGRPACRSSTTAWGRWTTHGLSTFFDLGGGVVQDGGAARQVRREHAVHHAPHGVYPREIGTYTYARHRKMIYRSNIFSTFFQPFFNLFLDLFFTSLPHRVFLSRNRAALG